jgi:predicted PurR-regulated permease PerM
MIHTTRSSHPRAHLVFLVGVFLAVALAITPQARSTVAQSKSAASRSKSPPAVSLRMTKTASKPASLHRELLMHLEEGQKGLQRQLESLTGSTQRRTDDLDHRIDTLTGQLSRLASAQQQSIGTQQLLTATIRPMRLLLMIIVGLLLILCGALFFFVYQFKRFDRSQVKEHTLISAPTGEPDETFEPQWKVSS